MSTISINKNPKRIKLIGCDVFTRTLCYFISQSEHIIDVEFIPMKAHEAPEILHDMLQKRIDASLAVKSYDYIILGYGLCGNATVGLSAQVPLIIPRVHDCCALFLGSNERFLEHFGANLSGQFATDGYIERCYLEHGIGTFTSLCKQTSLEYQSYVAQYDRDNADYLWDIMHSNKTPDTIAYISSNTHPVHRLAELNMMASTNNINVKEIQGDDHFLYTLVNGPWVHKNFLIVPANKAIQPVYDFDEVMKSS